MVPDRLLLRTAEQQNIEPQNIEGMYSGNFIKNRAKRFHTSIFDILIFQSFILLMMIILNTTFLVLARPPHSAWQDGRLVRVGDCVDYNTV